MRGALLVGGAGFLGRNIVDALSQRGRRAVIADPAVTSTSTLAHPFRLSDAGRLVGLLEQDDGLEAVVHLASCLLPSSDDAAFALEMERVVRPTFELIGACARLRRRFVLFSSGGTVYGDAGARAIREDREPAPTSRYGQAKLLLEQAVLQAHAREGLEYLILRPSNAYGRHQRMDAQQGLVAVAIGRAISGRSLEIWGDGSAVRDYVDVRDLACAVADLLEAGTVDRTLNVSTGIGHSVVEVLDVVERAFGRPIARIHRPSRAVDVPSVVLDPSALGRIVGWTPRSLEQGVADLRDEIGMRMHA
jgi:UDP-glucose 4-epimerase